ncbi:MAG: ABC transporter permease [Prevotellaceae bacterium]|nr:ABC transporter permease [Candidatus Colivivens equi]
MNIFRNILQAIYDTGKVFMDEMKIVLTDSGVIIFFFVVPLLYPILYSWLYNNETARDIPTAVIDYCHTPMSRDYIRRMDATSGIDVKYHCNSLEEGKELMMQQKCHALVTIPSTFSADIIGGRQTTVGLYADMSGMLYYKATMTSLTDLNVDMWEKIQISKQHTNYTSRDEELSVHPLTFEAVPLFNPAGGYGSFLLPAVLMLIIQQTLLLGIGLSAGTIRENNRYGTLVPLLRHYTGSLRIVFGKALCYFMVYLLTSTYITMVVPNMFHFIQFASFASIMTILVPYVLACTFLGLTISSLIRYRENVILIIVFTSVPLLFLSGVSWPESSIHGSWKAVSALFPSTFGINAFIKLNSLGASLADVRYEFRALWIQTLFYFLISAFVYWRQIEVSIHTRSLNAYQRALRRRGKL